MPLLSAVQLPPPSNWQDFEALCADLWAELYGNADLKGVGRLGQKQKGVDICGEIERGSYVGIQCKCVRADRMLNQDDVLKILDEAKDFCPTLDHLVIATTGLKDSGTEAFCRTLDDKRRSEGLSRITLYSWPDICALLQRYPEVAARHFPFAFRVPNLLVLRNDTNIRPPESKTYSFTKDEFVHPLIIEDLLGWISDPRETVVSVDLTSASGSNRYFGSIEVVRGDTVRVSVHEPDRGWFSLCASWRSSVWHSCAPRGA